VAAIQFGSVMQFGLSIINMLGSSWKEAAFQQCLSELNADYSEHENRIGKNWEFPRLGLELSSRGDILYFIFYHFDTEATRQQIYQPYTGELPAGISRSDTRKDVRKKLFRYPWSSERAIPCTPNYVIIWDSYELSAFEILVATNEGPELLQHLSLTLYNKESAEYSSELIFLTEQ